MHFKINCPRNSKTVNVEILMGHAVFKLSIKQSKYTLVNNYNLLKYKCCFLVLWTMYYKMDILFSKGVNDFKIKHANFCVGDSVPPPLPAALVNAKSVEH